MATDPLREVKSRLKCVHCLRRDIIIILFLIRPFLPCSARVRRLPWYEASPQIRGHCPFRVQTKLIHIIFYTLSPSLPAPAPTLLPTFSTFTTGRHPIISTLMFPIPKPPQSTIPCHLSHALNTQMTVQDLMASYPSETHHAFISPSYAYCPCLRPIFQHTLDHKKTIKIAWIHAWSLVIIIFHNNNNTQLVTCHMSIKTY